MSVYISAYKVIRPLDDPNHDRTMMIYTLDFPCVEHLSAFKEGWYEVEEIPNPFIDMAYSGYWRFREWISQIVLGVECQVIYDHLEAYANAPFFELINFADNEGCFDFVIAEKLLDDFNRFKDKVRGTFLPTYLSYMGILENAVKCKGIVKYS